MSDLVREIEEELKADKLSALWKEFQIPIIAGVTALILGTAGYSVWNNHVYDQNAKATAAIINALDTASPSSALLSVTDKKDHSVAATMMAASSIANTDSKKAIELYAQVIANNSAPQMLRHRAILDRVMLQMNDLKTLNVTETFKDLDEVAKTETLFAGEANLLKGLISDTVLKKPLEAQQYFQAVIDNKFTPQSLKERAAAFLSVSRLGAK
jgi:hypothetical protein